MADLRTRTPAQYAADLGATVKRAILAAAAACDPAWRALTAAALGKSRQRIDDVCDLGDDAQLSVRDLLAYPEPIRHALAALIVGDGYVIAALPAADACPDDLSLLAAHVRETSAAQIALVEAMADGTVSADEGARLVATSERVLSVSATVRALGQRALASRGVRLVARAR